MRSECKLKKHEKKKKRYTEEEVVARVWASACDDMHGKLGRSKG